MSLARTPDYLFRVEDQALKMLFENLSDESNSFDEYFNEEMYNQDTKSENSSVQQNLYDKIFSDETFSPESYKLLSFEDSSNFEQPVAQPWRKGVWCLKQTQQSAPLSVQKTRRTETKRTDTDQTMNCLDVNQQMSFLPNYATHTNKTKRLATSPNPAILHSVRGECLPHSREATLSPSPMYSQFPTNLDIGASTWQQDFQKFSLRQFYDEPPQSPLILPAQHIRPEMSARDANITTMSRNEQIEVMEALLYNGLGNGLKDQNLPGAIDPVLLDSIHPEERQGQAYYVHETTSQQTRHTTGGITSMRSPQSDSLPSSGSSSHPMNTTNCTSSTSVSGQSRSLLSPSMIPSHPPLPSLAPEEAYPALAAPKARRIPPPLLHQTSDSQLELQGPYSALDQIGGVLYEPKVNYREVRSPTDVNLPGVALSSNRSNETQPILGLMAAYPKLPPPPSHVFTNGSPFTPRKQRQRMSRSPSPSVSPTNVGSIRNPQHSPTRSVTDHGQMRRKSIHKQGPIRDAVSQEPMPSPRARSHSRPPRTPKTPKTPKANAVSGGFNIDFVNFTPKDSVKLLNDVAPSGSSKTRARRELEAKEKRKKLSEAALKAVQVAGGDVSVFERAIFT